MKRISIVGTAGVPASYGGFETLADNLAHYANLARKDVDLAIYCCGRRDDRPAKYNGAKLHYVPINANGFASVFYDAVSMFFAVLRRQDVILLLGVSGALFIPLVRLISSCQIITNIDGVEWRREKWGRFQSWYLRFSEMLAVRFSHRIICDNQGIIDYVADEYGVESNLIAYGGDHAHEDASDEYQRGHVSGYYLGLCRIEPENNVHLVLEAFARTPDKRLVFVGNWDASSYGIDLKARYASYPNVELMSAVYNKEKLFSIRSNAIAYVHGHSAGGTNPSLVEMMHFGIPVFAFDCVYNRYTTANQAVFFSSVADLIDALVRDTDSCVGDALRDIAGREYTWNKIGQRYFDLMIG